MTSTTSDFPVSLNGETHRVAAGTSLCELLTRLGQVPEQVATALNGEFVPRAQRADRLLHEGDRITCFQPIVGG